ncbi:hypothetical protein GCM10020331_062520 [Ectobacillus funiculus]
MVLQALLQMREYRAVSSLEQRKLLFFLIFLFTGVLIKRLEEMTEQFRLEYPEVEFQLAGYFGFHSRLQTILKDRAEEALQDEVKNEL